MLKKLSSFIMIFSIMSMGNYSPFFAFAENSDNLANTSTSETSEDIQLKAIDEELRKLDARKKELEALKTSIKNSRKKISTAVADGSQQAKDDIKIAVVFSGGASKGISQAGVLKVLEKYQIPIDIVIGSSVGSAVAAMYSIGYTPEEIEQFFINFDFMELLSRASDRNFQNMREKSLFDEYSFSFHMDKEKGISIPTGLAKFEKTYLMLKNIFNLRPDVHDYDSLPIKLRLLATNLQDGSQELLGNGDLALNVTKSMAFPGIFEPVIDDGKYYTDGGVTNNFPVKEAIDMGADYVIGIDITADHATITEDSNFADVITQISSYAGDILTDFQKQLPNILIVPTVKNRVTMDFSNISELQEAGLEGARAHKDALAKLSNPEKFKIIQEKRKAIPVVSIENINISGNRLLDLKTINALGSPKDMDAWFRKIYALPYIAEVRYEVENNNLNISVKEEESYEIFTTLKYATGYGPALDALLSIPNYYRGVRYMNETLVGVNISNFPKFEFKNISYFDMFDKKLGLSLALDYGESPLFVYDKGHATSTYTNQGITSEVELFTLLSDSLLAGIGGTYVNSNSQYKSGVNNSTYFDKNHNDFLSSAFIAYDSLNKKFFPTCGVNLRGNFTRNHSDESYERYTFTGNVYVPMSAKLSAGLGGSYGKISSGTAPNDKLFKIGGVNTENDTYSFYGLSPMARYASEFYTASLSLQYKATGYLYFMAKYNVLGVESDELSFQKNFNLDDPIHGFGLGVGVNTPFIPLVLFVSTNHDKPHSPIIDLRIGYKF